MGVTAYDGPLISWGNLARILNSAGVVLVNDMDGDAGPSMFYQGAGQLDVRFTYVKDKVGGYPGSVAAWIDAPTFLSVNAIPSAAAANNVAAAQTVANGVAMTLAGASTGITLNVPISPITALGSILNGNPIVTPALCLDFGFAFGNCTAGNATVQVADSTQFSVGMPLVIGGVGNSAGTACLLTTVASITDATHIVLNSLAVPAATNATAPIGAGNIWGPSELGFPLPTGAAPYRAKGPGLFLDAPQAIARGLQIVGVVGGAGGNFLVSGYDIYGEPLSQLVTVAAGASTGFTTKTFKYVTSIVPQFTDAGHNYTVGTSDVFGFHARTDVWELTNIFWQGVMAATPAGWTPADTTSPATTITGDVRGTIQTSSNGAGGGLAGGAASNGSIIALAMSGRRLTVLQNLSLAQVALGVQTNPNTMFGVPQT